MKYEMREHQGIGNSVRKIWCGFCSTITVCVLMIIVWTLFGPKVVSFLSGPTAQATQIQTPQQEAPIPFVQKGR